MLNQEMVVVRFVLHFTHESRPWCSCKRRAETSGFSDGVRPALMGQVVLATPRRTRRSQFVWCSLSGCDVPGQR